MDLKNKVAIVTGSASGIGQAIATLLASRGVKVIVTDIGATADETMDMIKEVGGEAAYFQGDISLAKTHEDMFDFCINTYGAPDIYVANAGLNGMVPMEDSTEEFFDRMVAVNIKGAFFAFKMAQKHMKPGSKIIIISSTSISYPTPGMFVYAATKGAVSAMMDVAAIELGRQGITVNAILPGVTGTKGAIENIPKEHQQNVINCTPLGRMGMPVDIAKAVAMLCSTDADWINGQHIEANGGASL